MQQKSHERSRQASDDDVPSRASFITGLLNFAIIKRSSKLEDDAIQQPLRNVAEDDARNRLITAQLNISMETVTCARHSYFGLSKAPVPSMEIVGQPTTRQRHQELLSYKANNFRCSQQPHLSYSTRTATNAACLSGWFLEETTKGQALQYMHNAPVHKFL